MNQSKIGWSSRRRLGRASWILGVTLALGCAPEALGALEDFPAEPDFLRFVEADGAQGERLETAILSYADKEGRSVDLVAVVHLGEKAYYDELDRRFRLYDGVLYELIAERGARPEPGREPGSMISVLQTKLTALLELEFQLDEIDYTAENMVHADVTPEELNELFAERKETLFSTILRAAFKMAAAEEGQQLSSFALLAAFFADDRSTQLKRVLARQFEDIDKLVAGFAGDDGTSVLVTERNARAMEVLAEQLGAGRKRLAIFYGAAHMEDFHARLIEQGFEGRSVQWLAAWLIRPSAVEPEIQED